MNSIKKKYQIRNKNGKKICPCLKILIFEINNNNNNCILHLKWIHVLINKLQFNIKLCLWQAETMQHSSKPQQIFTMFLHKSFISRWVIIFFPRLQTTTAVKGGTVSQQLNARASGRMCCADKSRMEQRKLIWKWKRANCNQTYPCRW